MDCTMTFLQNIFESISGIQAIHRKACRANITIQRVGLSKYTITQLKMLYLSHAI